MLLLYSLQNPLLLQVVAYHLPGHSYGRNLFALSSTPAPTCTFHSRAVDVQAAAAHKARFACMMHIARQSLSACVAVLLRHTAKGLEF
jgi:hypothetical protein